MASIANTLFTYPILSDLKDDFVNVEFIAGTTGSNYYESVLPNNKV